MKIKYNQKIKILLKRIHDLESLLLPSKSISFSNVNPLAKSIMNNQKAQSEPNLEKLDEISERLSKDDDQSSSVRVSLIGEENVDEKKIQNQNQQNITNPFNYEQIFNNLVKFVNENQQYNNQQQKEILDEFKTFMNLRKTLANKECISSTLKKDEYDKISQIEKG